MRDCAHPGGASQTFDFNESARVEEVIREAVTHFIRTGELAAGDDDLAPP